MPYFGASGGVPGGASPQIQFNNAGVFGGISGFTFDGTNILNSRKIVQTNHITFGSSTGFAVLTGSLADTYFEVGYFNLYPTCQSAGKYGWTSTTSGSAAVDTALGRNAAGVVEVNNGTNGTFRDLRVRSAIQQPPASVTPASNGDFVVEATSNTTLTFKLKGTDGTVRTGTLTLA